jgi:predicted Zn-dependent protease
MKKQIILLSVFLFSIHSLTAQQYLDSFKPLKSEGEIPSDFQVLINKKTNAADFNLFLKEMFLRGNILYGNKLNQYINTIADNVLKDYPTLRNELRFYILKSPVVNASATENGIILINVGLMAQVSSESELAFIISHEIVHYVEHHLIHLNNYEDKLNKKEYKDYYIKYHNRSREQEIEADKLGFERYYKHSPYSYAAINGVFDVLQYSELPFDEIPFLRSYMETDFYQFPENYFLSAITPIRSRDDYIDTLSTHPNIQKRRENIQYLSGGLSDEGRKTFVQSEALFKEIRDLARFECINLYLTQHEFEEAFYNTFILEKTFPDNSFLRLAKTASIYGIAKCKSQGRLSQAIENYKKREVKFNKSVISFQK